MMAIGVISALTRTVCWTAGMVEGAIDALKRAIGGQHAFGNLNDPTPLRVALLGRHRRHIVRVFGTPPAACVGQRGVDAGEYWEATTWYYPFDESRREAIAIRFENDRARKVEFIRVST
jgi:hypothetical protein